MEQLLARWQELWAQGEEREAWLRAVLALADRLWQGLWDLTITLRDIQQRVLDLEEGPLDPQAIQARLRTMQVLEAAVQVAGQACTTVPMSLHTHPPRGSLGLVLRSEYKGGGAGRTFRKRRRRKAPPPPCVSLINTRATRTSQACF